MTPDCGDLGNCTIPMWFQYLLVLAGVILLGLKCLWPRDQYDRL